jgi:hypothetical protein
MEYGYCWFRVQSLPAVFMAAFKVSSLPAVSVAGFKVQSCGFEVQSFELAVYAWFLFLAKAYCFTCINEYNYFNLH